MRLLRWVALGVISIMVMALMAGWVWLHSTLPAKAGTAVVATLGNGVRVSFDSLGIPTITASTEADLYTALGYLHARDRFWQMDLMRRASEGRLSELFGARAIGADRDARDWEMGRLADRAWSQTAPADRLLLDAYARGVNAWLANGRSSLEHRLLRLPAEPWRGTDTYAILLLEAKQLHNLGDERIRAQAVRSYGAGADTLLAPPWPAGAPVVIKDEGRGTRDEGRGRRDSMLTSLVPRPLSLVPRLSSTEGHRGSNSWVVSGSRSATGHPLLANDPHLPLSMPSIWYLAALHAPGVDAVGATIPGVPGIVIGRNRQIAWAMTASYVDDVDEVEEELSPDSSRVRRRSGWDPVETVAETLLVRGNPAVIYTRRRTSNGPLVRWIRATPPLAVARRWSGQDETPAGLLASLRLMKEQDWAGFRAALRELRAPTLGLTYADAAGHIGYQLAGGVPVRAVDGVGSSGPGWTTDSAWRGYLPFDALPSVLDAAPFLVTSNNRIAGADYPHFLSSAWASPYRAERITQMLGADSSVSVADAARMQMDVTSLFAQRAKAVAARAAASLGDSSAARALQGWDGSMRAESAEATLFWRWYEAVQEELRGIPAAFPATWAAQHRWILSDTVLLANGRSFSFDSLSTAAMRVALADPRARQAWGRVHQLVERHPLGDLPLLGRLLRLNIGPVGVPGGDFTVNLCASAGDRIPVTCTEGPSMRFLADMASDQGSWFVLPAGQSGNPMSRHYRDQFPLWLHGSLAHLPVVPDTDSTGEILELVPGR